MTAQMGPEELTAEEARSLVDELGLDLYRAQDALAFVEECCAIADRQQRTITTSDVREWLKGAQCGRQMAADPQRQQQLAAIIQAAQQRYATEQGTAAGDVHPLEALGYHAMGQGIDLDRVRAACDQLRRAAVLADGQPHTDRERGIIHAVDRITAALNQPAHNDGPSVAEAAEADRRWWDSEKTGETNA